MLPTLPRFTFRSTGSMSGQNLGLAHRSSTDEVYPQLGSANDTRRYTTRGSRTLPLDGERDRSASRESQRLVVEEVGT